MKRNLFKPAILVSFILFAFACKKEEDANKLPGTPVLFEPMNGSVTGTDSLVFKWQESQDAEGDKIAYTLYISSDSVNWKQIPAGFGTTVKLSGLVPSNYWNYYLFLKGQKYYWKVKAENYFEYSSPKIEEGESVSPIGSFYTTPPGVSTLRDTSGHQFVNLYWSDPENLDHLEITFTPSVSTISQPINVNAGMGGMKVQGLENGTVYTFALKAFNKLGHVSVADTIRSMPVLPNQVYDADYHIYTTVKIGAQTWLAQNLKVTCYQNGIPIDKTLYSKEAEEGYGFCYHPWVALDQVKKIAPRGYHIATDGDWKVLEEYIGMPASDLDIISSFNGIGAIKNMKERGAAVKCGKALAATSGWNDYNAKGGNGTDFYHLGIYPAGYTYGSEALPGFTGDIAHILTSTVSPIENGVTIVRVVSNQSDGIYRAYGFTHVGGTIRCIKD
jgi:uncharacterized protein (TIGR02145 family)